MRYRKLPIEVEAWTVGFLVSCFYDGGLPKEIKKAEKDGILVFSANSIHVTTLEGKHIAKISDVLVRGIRGEYYGVKKEIFSDTYEQA
jgi:hypothetical protein